MNLSCLGLLSTPYFILVVFYSFGLFELCFMNTNVLGGKICTQTDRC
jgi:hypothetical protein